MSECVVYHKHLEGMGLEDGYIGVSKNYDERMKQHKSDAFLRNSVYTVHENMRRYGDEVITDIIFRGTIEECFDLEQELRPSWRIGWNMAMGGGRPGSGWKPNPKWLSNELYNEKTKVTVIISKDMTLTDWGQKFNIHMKTASDLLLGKITKNGEGWQLRDSQLVNRVENRIKSPFGYVIVEHESGKRAKVFDDGMKDFSEVYGHRNKIAQMFRGIHNSTGGWYLVDKSNDYTETYGTKSLQWQTKKVNK